MIAASFVRYLTNVSGEELFRHRRGTGLSPHRADFGVRLMEARGRVPSQDLRRAFFRPAHRAPRHILKRAKMWTEDDPEKRREDDGQATPEWHDVRQTTAAMSLAASLRSIPAFHSKRSPFDV
jgi:hypothetical protein